MRQAEARAVSDGKAARGLPGALLGLADALQPAAAISCPSSAGHTGRPLTQTVQTDRQQESHRLQ